MLRVHYQSWLSLVLLVLTTGIPLEESSRVFAQYVGTHPIVGVRDVRPARFALAHATLITKPGYRIDDATLLIEDGLIAAVDHKGPLPDDCQVLDCTGFFVYAGFIDSFGELDLPSTSSRSGYWNPNVMPQRSTADSLREVADLDAWRSSGFTARLVAPKSGQIKGTSALVATRVDDDRPLVIRGNAAMHASLTTRFSFDRPGDYPGSPMGAVALVRQALYDMQWYRDAWRSFRSGATSQQPEFNIALETLVQVDQDQMPWIVDASNERYVSRADRLGREFGLPIIVRGSGREYRRLTDLVETGRGVILPLDFPKAPDVSTVESAVNVTLERLMHWDLAPENPARLASAGVEIAFTTSGFKKPSEFWPALRQAIRRGLPPDDALAALTTTPARWFDVADRLGTLERGKAASFVIADRDLFRVEEEGPDPAILETWVVGTRYRHRVRPRDDVRGTWQLKVADQPDNMSATIVLRGQGQRLRGEWQRNDTKIKLDSVELAPLRLQFSATGNLFEQTGAHRFTLLLTHADLAQETMGHGAWPDGSAFRFTARRIEPSNENDGAGDTKEKAEDSSPAENGDTKPPESKAKASSIRSALADVQFPLGAYGRQQPPTQPTCVVFQHATVWTCGPQGVLADADVIVRQGLIEAVGASLPVPEGALVVDCRGKHLSPGIIDCHSHIATDGGINEGTQAITAEVRIADFIDADDISIYRQLAGGVTTANVLHGSANPIGGQNQVIKLRWGDSPEALKFRDAPPGIKFALGENVKQSNWGDRYTTRYPQTRMGVDELMDDAFRRAAEYVRHKREWLESRQGLPPRVDLELEALAEVLAGTRWIHCHSYQQGEMLAFMKTCERHGVRIGTLQHVLEGYKIADEMARRGVMGSAFSDWWAYKFEVYDAIPYAGALMHDAGVVVSFNSDDPEMGRRLNLEAAKAMRYGGLSAEDALKFVTLNPARQLRIEQRVGSIEQGKDADVAVWSGDPLSVYSRCEQTWIDGKRYFDLAENEQLEKRDQSLHAALVQRILTVDVPTIKASEERPDPDELWPRHDEYCHGHSHP